MILDAEVLISYDRGEFRAACAVEALRRAGRSLVTSETVVAQVWRGGSRQAPLAKLLTRVEVHPFEEGRRVGAALAASDTSDVVDAHLVLLAVQLGDEVLTGDPDDLRRVARAFGPLAPTIHAWP